jgi:hypothetical protein
MKKINVLLAFRRPFWRGFSNNAFSAVLTALDRHLRPIAIELGKEHGSE